MEEFHLHVKNEIKGEKIDRNILGRFIEHLFKCIDEGVIYRSKLNKN